MLQLCIKINEVTFYSRINALVYLLYNNEKLLPVRGPGIFTQIRIFKKERKLTLETLC